MLVDVVECKQGCTKTKSCQERIKWT